MSWISPDWLLDVLLVSDAILDRVLDVSGVGAQALVVTLLCQVSDLEGTELRCIVSERRLLLEVALASVGLSERVEGAVLVHRGRVRLVFVQDLSSPSLVI